jgi:hypothetical protein
MDEDTHVEWAIEPDDDLAEITTHDEVALSMEYHRKSGETPG